MSQDGGARLEQATRDRVTDAGAAADSGDYCNSTIEWARITRDHARIVARSE